MKHFTIGLIAGATATAVAWTVSHSLLITGVVGGLAFAATWAIEAVLDRR